VAKPKDNAEAGRHLIREVLIHATISHGNIARLLEIIDLQDEIFIIFPFYSGGTLHDRVMQASRLNENESNAYFRQLISSIQYLHVNGIIHRDLKLCNIIIDANDTIKVCDFGLAHIMLPDGQLDSLCGSPEYASPELISNQKYDPKADIWACGIILYAMLTGKLPFMDSFPPRLYACILSGEYEQPIGISSEGQDLIQRILQRDPLIRAGHEDIFRHAWTNRLNQAQMEFAAKTETKEIQPEELAKLTKFGFLACEIAEFGVLQKPGPIRAVFELSE
jgi:serine/threonine protein kinase